MLFKNCLSTFFFSWCFPFSMHLLPSPVLAGFLFLLISSVDQIFVIFFLGSPKINIYYHWYLTFILICEVILITADNHCKVLGCITCIIPLNPHNKLMNYLFSLFYWWNSERLGTSQNWRLNLDAPHSRIHVLNTMLWGRLQTQERLTDFLIFQVIFSYQQYKE